MPKRARPLAVVRRRSWNVQWLEALGYHCSFICRDRLLPLSQFDAEVHQRQHGEWFWKSRDYCNNFVFAKRPAAAD